MSGAGLPIRASRAFPALSALDIATLALAILLAIPVASVAVSLFTGISPTFIHIAETVLSEYALNTLMLGAMVIVGVLAIGVPAAWLAASCEFPGRRVLEAALILPLAAPAYVLAYAYAGFLAAYGPVQMGLRDFTGWEVGDYWFPDVRSLTGAAAMLILVLYPYVYLLARARFLSESASAMEAARLLGRGPWSSFFAVSLPLARPALVAGAALAAMETFADYGTVSYFGVPAFTTGIYNAWYSFSDPKAAAQLASILIGFVALALVAEHSLRGPARFHETGRRDRRPTRYKLNAGQSALAIIACALPPIFGFLVPALVLLSLLIDSGGPTRDFGRHLFNSLTLSAGAAVIVTAGALLLAFAKKERPKALVGRAANFASMGYAVPGAVIAIGVLGALVAIDNAVDFATQAIFGVPVGLVLTGGVVALMFAYLVLYLAVALQSITAGLERITPSIGAAAKLLSRGSWDVLMRVHLPLIAPSVLTAALLVFVDVMKELPATLMLRPFNFDTLAIAANNYASDERLNWAAAPSLAIVAAGIIPCILLIRGIAAAQHGKGSDSPS
uniref:Ferric iron ABC transporter permease protein n=1 Tax=uncultured bacterium BLR7 TaxID=506523 RepID=C0INP9_9BACT|nr:ferric iron ABC transporter permease protein [uncultured bacterium BLR7]